MFKSTWIDDTLDAEDVDLTQFEYEYDNKLPVTKANVPPIETQMKEIHPEPSIKFIPKLEPKQEPKPEPELEPKPIKVERRLVIPKSAPKQVSNDDQKQPLLAALWFVVGGCATFVITRQ